MRFALGEKSNLFFTLGRFREKIKRYFSDSDGTHQSCPKTCATIAERPAASAAVKAAGWSLSISGTAISAPAPLRTGSTISDRVEAAQAIWPGTLPLGEILARASAL
jgi:hypothetical protein